MKPIILKADENGVLMISAEEIEKIARECYEEGYKDGKNSVPTHIQTSPLTSPTYPSWLNPSVTCKSIE